MDTGTWHFQLCRWADGSPRTLLMWSDSGHAPPGPVRCVVPQPGRILGCSALIKGQLWCCWWFSHQGRAVWSGVDFYLRRGRHRAKQQSEMDRWEFCMSLECQCWLSVKKEKSNHFSLSQRKHSKNDCRLFHLHTHTHIQTPLNCSHFKEVGVGVNDIPGIPTCTPHQGYGKECAWVFKRFCLLALVAAIDSMLRLWQGLKHWTQIGPCCAQGCPDIK